MDTEGQDAQMLGLKPMIMIGYIVKRLKRFTGVLIFNAPKKTVQTQNDLNFIGIVEISFTNYWNISKRLDKRNRMIYNTYDR